MSRLNKQERAAQNAAQASGRPAWVKWLYPAQTRDVPVAVRAKKKIVGYEMRYEVDGVAVTRKELLAAMEVTAQRMEA